MRIIGGFGAGGALLGALAGVLAHFTSHTAREGRVIVSSASQLLVRPPWSALVVWCVGGLIVGLVLGAVLRVLGFRLVRDTRSSGTSM